MIKLRDNDTFNFDILAPMASADGYGYSAEELIRSAVTTHGANIGYVVHDWQDRRYTGDDVQQLEIPSTMVGEKQVFVIYFIPYAFYQLQGRAEFPIGQTMFETTEIPDIWAHCCNEYTKGIIVPSSFNKEVFAKKVDKPIEVVPLGVNLETYHYIERTPSDIFTFLMAGLLHYRKGAQFAVRAFKDEFSQSDNVRLILKTRKGFLDVGAESLDDSRIQVVDCDYSRADMMDLYHAGDCFIASSRGEASGLTPREAMATGIPAIVTDWGGLSEIADERYTYPVGIDDIEQAPPVCSSYDSGVTQGQHIGDFCRPSVAGLRQAMREAYDDREANAEKGYAASQWIAKTWNYDKCAKRWLEAINEIYSGYEQYPTGLRP